MNKILNIVVLVIGLCFALSLAAFGQEICPPRPFLGKPGILDLLKNGDKIAKVTCKAEDLVSAVLAARQQGIEPEIKVYNSHISGTLELWKLGLPHQVTPAEAKKWNLDSGQNVLVIPNSIEIRESSLDSIRTITARKVIFTKQVTFDDSSFSRAVDFRNTIFNKDASFRGVTFHQSASYNGDIFLGSAYFQRAVFNQGGSFSHTRFIGNTDVSNTTFNNFADFRDVTFSNAVDFRDTTFNDYTDFRNTTFSGTADFGGVTFKECVDFANTSFTNLMDKSQAFSLAVRGCERVGNTEEADHYFFRHMVAERRLKSWYNPSLWLDLIAEGTCGYGTSWYRVLSSWGVIIIFFTFVYWLGHGISPVNENSISFWPLLGVSFYFSIATFLSLSPDDYKPAHKYSKGFAIAEALIGAFMIALFVVVFARKFMR